MYRDINNRKTLREKKRSNKRTVLFRGALIIILVSFVIIMNNDYFLIKEVEISGEQTLGEEELVLDINEFLSEKYLWLLPKRNFLFFSSAQLENRLRTKFPKILKVDADLVETKRLVITLDERFAHSLWCVNKEYEQALDEECYFADNDGILYARAPYFSGDIFLKFFFLPQREGQNYFLGENVFSYSKNVPLEDFLTFLEAIQSEYGIHVFRIFFEEFDDVSMEISSIDKILYERPFPKLFFNQSDDYATLFRNIGIAFGTPGFEKDFREQPQNLESLDLRVDGRIFYTFSPQSFHNDHEE